MENQSAHQAIQTAKQALRRGDRAEARRWAQLAAQQNPEDETAWLILGATAEPRASVQYLRRALELNPGSRAAQEGLAWAEERLRKAENAAPLAQAPGGAPRAESIVRTTAKAAGVTQAEQGQAEITQPVRVHARQDAARLRPEQKSLHERWATFWKKRQPEGSERAAPGTLERVLKYTLVRGAILLVTVFVSLFLIINIANLGGYLDTIQKALISEDINGMLRSGWLRETSEPERTQTIEETQKEMEASYGLDQPYMTRVVNWLGRGITMNWGQSRNEYVISSTYYIDGTHTGDVYTSDVGTEIATFLPRTLLLLGVANLAIFLVSILVGLLLNRKPGSWIDRLIRGLAPLSAAPAWIFGMLLSILFINVLGIYSFRMGLLYWPTNIDARFILTLIQGLTLPFLAIFVSKFFQSVYSWRTYFLSFSNESYLELAKAKGLPAGMLERRYLLRPALPNILTSFALILITVWQECIAVEFLFNVGGIGTFFLEALNSNDIIVVVALVSLFAYLLAITVFILDIIYALVDPRLKILADTQGEKPLTLRERFRLRAFVPRATARPAGEVRAGWGWKKSASPGPSLVMRLAEIRQRLAEWRHEAVEFWREFRRYRSGVAGVALIGMLLLISLGTVIAIPYNRAIEMWRGDELGWIRNPAEAQPAWTNFFRQQKLPENIQLSTLDATASKQVTTDASGNPLINVSFQFDYNYHDLPQNVLVLFHTQDNGKRPFAILTWITPEGRQIPLKNMAISDRAVELVENDAEISNRLKRVSNIETLFTQANGEGGSAAQGSYELRLNIITFDKATKVDVEMVVYGQVYGLMGTDLQRKDLLLALLWGIVAALTFGIVAALITTLASVALAAAGAWFGGWVDALIQRISEVNMVLPVLPTSILIFYLYSKSFFVILGVTVGLNIFGSAIKNYRAMFLQIKQAPYVEAAQSYGAPGWRIILQYLIPKVRTVLIPQLIILVPGYVFFEATLALLGVSDPYLPTLGNLLIDTLKAGMSKRPAYLLLEPIAVLIVIAAGFALAGVALEKMYSDREAGG